MLYHHVNISERLESLALVANHCLPLSYFITYWLSITSGTDLFLVSIPNIQCFFRDYRLTLPFVTNFSPNWQFRFALLVLLIWISFSIFFQIKDIKDSVEYYIENCREPDFMEDDGVYDDIDGLEEMLSEVNVSSKMVSSLSFLFLLCFLRSI